jgi:hypothetical protein
MDDSGNQLAKSRKRGAPLGNKRAVGNSGGGRKPKYQPAMVGIARKACERGMVDLEIADLLGVNVATLYRWKFEHSQFARSFKLGKAEADDRVERALFSRAVGYDFNVEKQVMTRHGPRMLRWREHAPPDVSAAMAYLKNRRPDRWRDASRIEHVAGTIYDGVESAAELRQLLSKEALRLGLIAPSDQAIVDVTPSQSANSDDNAIAPSEDHTAAKAPKTAADAKNASVTYVAKGGSQRD